MPTHRFPTLVWQDHAGLFTASLVECHEAAGFGRTSAEAREQLEEYLEWAYQQECRAPPDLQEAQLHEFRVPVRPEYEATERRYPCDDVFPLRVIAVMGRLEGGMRLCSLPTLNIRFYFHQDDSLRELVRHYVQQELRGYTPQRLSRCVAPSQVQLHDLIVRVPTRSKLRLDEAKLPTLNLVAEPLGERRLRQHLGPAWERDEEVRSLVERLGRENANVLIVAEPGSGKTTVLLDAVRQLERKAPTKADESEDENDATRQHKRRFWQTSGQRLISGMKYLGQWEERCEKVISEINDINGVLCVENLLDLIRTGGREASNSVAAFLLPYLQRGELRLVAEATPSELDACRRLLPGFADVFQVLKLPPFGRQQTLAVLARRADAASQQSRITTARGVPELIYHLFQRFLPYHALPGKAVKFFSDVCERQTVEQVSNLPEARGTSRQVESLPYELKLHDVIAEFVRQTGLPDFLLRDELPVEWDSVAETFTRQVIDQDAAVRAAADLVVTFKAGLNDPQRPLGVLLFCGPTGVGKTELAKSLAKYFFGHGEQPDRLIRLDMSEYSGPGAADRLIAKRNGDPSDLIQKLRAQPFSVVLLDEIEKADPEVFDVLLNVFDEGRLTDRFGRVTTFRSAVLIMTSNIGAHRQVAFGFSRTPNVHYESEALSFFRPEFFNRIDAIVTFEPLRRETILAITRKELKDFAQREGLKKAGLKLDWTDEVVARLADLGYDQRYGARPLQRTLEVQVVTPLARFLVEHPSLRDATVRLSWDAGRRAISFDVGIPVSVG